VGVDFSEVLWIEYYYLTESYDRSFPHLINNNDEAIVLPPYRSLSDRYAYELKRIMLNHFHYRDKSRIAYRYNFEQLTEAYERLDEYPLTNTYRNRMEEKIKPIDLEVFKL
jgi:hypothetical protein